MGRTDETATERVDWARLRRTEGVRQDALDEPDGPPEPTEKEAEKRDSEADRRCDHLNPRPCLGWKSKEEDGVRVKSVLIKLLGLGITVVVTGWNLEEGERAKLVVWVRRKAGVRGRCGRCGEKAPFFDHGGGERRWRHVDVGFATCELVAEARRVDCPAHGPTVAALPFARHDSWFTRAFEDLVVYDAIVSSKLAAARRHEVSWRAVDHMCERVAMEALGRVDLLSGLVAIAIDEVKYKKGQRYLTVVCDHFTGKVVWAQKGRSKQTVGAFFDALGAERAGKLQFVTCDGAEWIRTVLAERAPGATVCLDTFHLVSWATDALDQVRRDEWNELRRRGGMAAAKALKGMRFLLLRNWENLSSSQKGDAARPRACEPAPLPRLAAERGAARAVRPPAHRRPAGARRMALLRQPLASRAVRAPRPDGPSLPGLGRGDDRVADHERHLRVEQRRDRPHPLGRAGLPRRALRDDGDARPGRHRTGTALGHCLMTHDTGRRPQNGLSDRPRSGP